MSHPKNKRDRFLVGVRKGKKRADGYWGDCAGLTGDFMEKMAQLRRNTTKLCSCAMCGNPRRKLKDLTIQEKRYYCGVEQSGSS